MKWIRYALKMGAIAICLLILVASPQKGVAQNVRVLTLEECVDIAIDNNIDVKRARLALEGSQVDLRESKAGRWPNANANWNYGINWGRSIDPTTNQFTTDQINSSGLGGTSNVVLFSGLQQHYGIARDRTGKDQSQANLEDAINIVSLNIVTFYLNVIFNKELLENARYQLESSESQLARVKLLVSSGAAPRSQELELVSQVASNEVALINAQNNLDLALLSLKQAMLIPASQQIDILIPNIDLDGEPDLGTTSQEVYDDAVDIQPNIQGADLGVMAARYGVKAAEGARYPTVSFGGSYNTNFSSAFDERDVINDNVAPVPTGLFTTSGEDVLTLRFQDSEPFNYFDQFQENRRWNLG
ncbi:MAG: TolC family protein, partial [Bacteroidota bacterium]